MNFFLTTYIYPIESPVILSEALRFTLDNPCTPEEIGIIRNYLEVSLNSPDEAYEHEYSARIPIEKIDDVFTIQQSLEDFEQKFSQADSYVKEFFRLNKTNDLLMLLSKMWIIARFDDEGESERLAQIAKEERAQGHVGFFLLEDENPILKNSNKLINYSHLLSLLIHNAPEEYTGGSFIAYNDIQRLKRPKIDRSINQNIMFFCFMAYPHKPDDSSLWRFHFPFIRDKLLSTAKELETVWKNESPQETILYIANLLKVSSEDIKDERSALVTLVSILELLLTHNPDFNRFNIEDSISKQFKLKASILVYLNDKTKDLNWIKKRLAVIYNQRSNIAHGNFTQFNKYLKSLPKKEGEEEYFSDLILDLLLFIRSIIEEYIKDSGFVDFLKEN